MVSMQQQIALLNKKLAMAKSSKSVLDKIVAKENKIKLQKQREIRKLNALKNELAQTNKAILSTKFRKFSGAKSKVKSFIKNPETQRKLKKISWFVKSIAEDISKALKK